MHCIVLGNSGTMPMPGRALNSSAVRVEGAVYLFDCGEGTQIPYKVHHVGLRALRVVAITHLHADHVLGLPGLLMGRGQMESPDPLILIGPVGLERFVRNVIRDLACRIPFELRFVEIPPDREPPRDPPREIYRDELITLRWLPLHHSVFCVGYRLEEHARPGKFDGGKAHRLGLPPGPLYSALQRGESVRAPDGQEIQPEDVMGPARRGRHLAYCTDTGPCRGLYGLLDRVDLALLEGMFLPEHEAEATAKRHMLVTDSARIAGRAQVRQALLTHFSPRYRAEDIARMDVLAQEICPSVRVSVQGERVDIPLPE